MARTRQPQGTTRVNAKWLSRGLVASFNPAIGFKDLARSNNSSGIVGNITQSVGLAGRAWQGAYQTSNNYVHVPRTADLAYTTGVTFEALLQVDSFQTSSFPYLSGVIAQQQTNAAGDVDYFAPGLRFNDSASIEHVAYPHFYLYQIGVTRSITLAAAQSTGTLLHLFGTYDGANIAVYCNGASASTALTGAFDNDANSFISLLSEYTVRTNLLSHNRCLNGKMFLANIYNRGLTAAEVSERLSAPWGHLESPRRVWVQLGPAAGGGASNANLVLPDAAQAQSADAVVLTTASSLVVADATQSQLAGSVVLDASTATPLAVADATHAMSSDAPTLAVASVLAVVDATQAQATDAATLTSLHSLSVSDSTHAHAAEVPTLDTSNATPLVIADATHGHTVDSLALLAACLLSVADATQAQQTDSIDLSTLHHLAAADATHAMTSESTTLTIPGTGTGATAEEIVIAMMAALNATTIPVNVEQVNGVPLAGSGTDGDPWR